ncbi:hypothetical protein RSA46_21515 [Pseudomonas oryzihabitans]|nr:hypothetical protein SB5_20145 [Pseudomonas psychrotolerans]KTT42385.1 hypothetical protein RSA46_21515 [Pseudomonas psychrotolerans]KTT49651.1 hypothetical protein SB11R_09935 [Pseudomonas psychrotolerans]
MSTPSLSPRDIGKKHLRALVAFALEEGWVVTRTHGGHLRFTKTGFPPIFTSSTPSDHRAGRNARAQLRRAQSSNELDQPL